MIQIILALLTSLGGSVGGKAGALAVQLASTIGTAIIDEQAWLATVGPWVTWVNAIIDAGRDPTAAEDAAARAFAQAVHDNNQSLGTGGPGVPLPSPPA